MKYGNTMRARRNQITVALLILGILGISSWHYAVAQNEEKSAEEQRVANLEKPERAFAAALPAYSLAAVNADPGYYNKIRPARAWQHATLPAGKRRHEPLEVIGEGFYLVAHHTQLPSPLKVKAKPGRPVTFSATDGGHFVNGENSITIKADAQGVAQADFWVEDAGDFNVWVGSPENDGPVQYIMQALPPAELLAEKNGQAAAAYQATLEQAKKDRAIQRARIDAKIQAKRSQR